MNPKPTDYHRDSLEYQKEDGNERTLAESSRFQMTFLPDRTQLFMFSAVTWNRHRIHYDLSRANEEGFPDVPVQRGLIGNFFTRFMCEWLKGKGRMRYINWRMKKSAFPGQELICYGIKDTETSPGQYQLWMVNPKSETIATAEAEVVFE